MKKVVSILLLALVLALAFTSCSNYDEQMENIYQQQEQINILAELIEKLNQTIKDLENDLADTQDMIDANKEIIDALEKDSIKTEEWDEATQLLAIKIKELYAVKKAYMQATDENGEIILDMSKYWNWNMRADELQAKAVSDLSRATSVAKMDEIIAQYEKDLRSIPTRVEELYALVDSIEADGVTVEDYEAIRYIMMYDMFNIIGADEFHGETHEEQVDAKEQLYKRFDVALEEYKLVATAYFIEMVSELPNIDDVKISDKHDVMDVMDYYHEHLIGELGLVLKPSSPVAKGYKMVTDLLDRIVMLETLKAMVDSDGGINDMIRNAFTDKKFRLNIETLAIIDSLEAQVNMLFYGYVREEDLDDPNFVPDSNCWENLLDISLIPEDADFNEYVYNFVDHATVEAYRHKYECLREELEVAVEAFYNAVKAYDNVTSLQSYLDAEKAATEAYSDVIAIVGLDKINDIDTLLGNTTEDDKIEMIIDGVEVEVFPFVGHKTVYVRICSEVNKIDLYVNKVVNYISKTVRDLVCTDPTHVPYGYLPDAGQKTCDCTRTDKNAVFGDINEILVEHSLTEFKTTVSALKTLMASYEFTTAEILGENYADYLEVAAISLKLMAYDYIEASATIADEDKAACKLLVDRALANGVVFEMEYDAQLDCTDDDIQDTSAYVWSGATKTLFDALMTACGH